MTTEPTTTPPARRLPEGMHETLRILLKRRDAGDEWTGTTTCNTERRISGRSGVALESRGLAEWRLEHGYADRYRLTPAGLAAARAHATCRRTARGFRCSPTDGAR